MEEFEFDKTQYDEAESNQTEQDGHDDDPDGHAASRDVWAVLSGVHGNIGIVVTLLQDVLQPGHTEPGQGGHAEHVGLDVDSVELRPDVEGDSVLVGDEGERSAAGLDTVSARHGAVEVEGEGRAGRGRH